MIELKKIYKANNKIYKIELLYNKKIINVLVLNDTIKNIFNDEIYYYFKNNGKTIHSINTIINSDSFDIHNEHIIFDNKGVVIDKKYDNIQTENITNMIKIDNDSFNTYQYTQIDKFNICLKYPNIRFVEDYLLPIEYVMETVHKILKGKSI